MVTVTTSTGRAVPATEDGEDGSLIERIIEAYEPVVAAQRSVIARVWRDRSISKLNLHLLMLLCAHGPQPMGRLAALADVSLPNLTAMVDRMEQLRLVKRVQDDSDRRVVIVRPTARGRSQVEEIESIRREEMRRILRRLSPSEQRLCLRAMQAMARAAEAGRPD